jgi:hypothetical protein
MVSRGVVKKTAVIDNVIVLTVRSKDAVMAGAIAHRIISGQDLGRSARKRASGRRTGDITNTVRTIAPTVPDQSLVAQVDR